MDAQGHDMVTPDPADIADMLVKTPAARFAATALNTAGAAGTLASLPPRFVGNLATAAASNPYAAVTASGMKLPDDVAVDPVAFRSALVGDFVARRVASRASSARAAMERERRDREGDYLDSVAVASGGTRMEAEMSVGTKNFVDMESRLYFA